MMPLTCGRTRRRRDTDSVRPGRMVAELDSFRLQRDNADFRRRQLGERPAAAAGREHCAAKKDHTGWMEGENCKEGIRKTEQNESHQTGMIMPAPQFAYAISGERRVKSSTLVSKSARAAQNIPNSVFTHSCSTGTAAGR